MELEKKWWLDDNEAKEKWRQAENIENVSQQFCWGTENDGLHMMLSCF